MSDLSVVLLSAGESTRFGLKAKKQWLFIEDMPLWLFVARRFEKFTDTKNITITATKEEESFYKKYCNYNIISGGSTRQESILNALEKIDTPYVLISDIARVCVSKELIENILQQKGKAHCIAPYINPPDTVVYHNETINREEVKLIQTPQLSQTKILKKALGQDKEYTDESSAIKAIDGNVLYIKGDKKALKLTHKEDLELLKCLKGPKNSLLVGIGFDTHPFCKDKELFLGGVKIDHPYGLKGHSDADALLHAIIDALLGAANFGDIGELFPDSNNRYKAIDSKILLKKTKEILEKCGFEIVKIDVTILAQEPKISPYKEEIANTISKILDIEKFQINIKATTTEKLGFIGRAEAIAAEAIATLKYFNWSENEGINC